MKLINLLIGDLFNVQSIDFADNIYCEDLKKNKLLWREFMNDATNQYKI